VSLHASQTPLCAPGAGPTWRSRWSSVGTASMDHR